MNDENQERALRVEEAHERDENPEPFVARRRRLPPSRSRAPAAFALKDSHRRDDYVKLAERLLAARVKA